MEFLWQDTRFAIRKLRNSPVFVSVSVLSLTVSLAAFTTMLAVVQARDFNSLPFRNPNQLVAVSRREPLNSACPACRHRMTPPAFLAMRERARDLSELEASRWQSRYLLIGDDRLRVEVREATIRFLPMLGVAPMIGRPFLPADTATGAPPVMLVSYALWKTAFAQDSAIVGKPVQVLDPSGRPTATQKAFTVIGVLPASFVFDGRAKVWTPFDLSAGVAAPRQRSDLDLIGRLRLGITVQLADAELRSIDNSIQRDRSPVSRDIASVESLKTVWTDEGQIANERFALLGVAGIVVLIAVLNIVTLSVARSAQRQTERAVFLALGAPWLRWARQFAIEMCIVTGAGGLLALLGARLAIRAVGAHFYLNTVGLSGDVNFSLVATILALVFALGAGIGFGGSRWLGNADFGTILRGTSVGTSVAAGRLRYLFVACEIVLALVVLSAGGLLTGEYARILSSEIGFDPRNLHSVAVHRPMPAATNDPQLVRLRANAAVLRLASLPQVRDVSAWSGDTMAVSRLQPNGTQIGEEEPLVVQDVLLNYFKTMGLRIVAGRAFLPADDGGTGRVAIVGARAADRLWPGSNALGQQLRFGSPGTEELATVVGVVSDYEVDGYLPPLHLLHFYRPTSQGHPNGVTAIVRLTTSSSPAMSTIRRAATDLRGDPVGSDEVVSLERSVNAGLEGPRFNAGALLTLSAFSLFLAAIGVYGVVASGVLRRTREIGIRVALGAAPRDVIWQVSRGSAIVLGIATTAGLVGAMATTRILKSQLYATSPTDPMILGGSALLLVLIGMFATFLPARHAANLDPMTALRSE